MNENKPIDFLAENLKRLTIRGGVVTFVGQLLKVAFNIISMMALSRMLKPEDFGLLAMTSTVMAFLMIFKDWGLTLAIIQSPNISQQQLNTLFVVNVILGITLSMIFVGLAPVISWFYGDGRLGPIAVSLSAIFFIGALSSQQQALLRKNLKLIALTITDIISVIIGSSVGMLLAYLNYEYWALVYMQLAGAIVLLIGVWISSDWRPSRIELSGNVGRFASFGSYLTGYSFGNYFVRNLDNILIGRYLGAQHLGFYSKAYSLLLFPIGQIVAPMTMVAVPALSKLQGDSNRFNRYYLKAVKIVAYSSMPLTVCIGVLAHEIIMLVLGNQWQAAVPIFIILSFTAFFQPVDSTVGWVFVSLGLSDRMFKWAYLTTPIIAIAMVIGLPWGVIGVAIGYAVSNVVLVVPQFYFALKGTPVSPVEVLVAIWRPIAVSVLVGVGALLGKSLMVNEQPIVVIGLSLLSGFVVLIFICLMFRGVRSDLADIFSLIKSLV